MSVIITKKNQKAWNIFFLLVILLPTLFVYKYIYNFRINQATIINLLTITIFTYYIFLTIKEEKLEYSTNSLNFPILLFILIAVLSIFITNSFWVTLKVFINLLSFYLIYFLIINNIKNKKSLYFCLIVFFFRCKFNINIFIDSILRVRPFPIRYRTTIFYFRE